MIRPCLRSRMSGSTALVMRTTPKKLVSKTARASSSVVSSATPTCSTPALLMSTSIRPRPRLHFRHTALDGIVGTHVQFQHLDTVLVRVLSAAGAEDAKALLGKQLGGRL